MKNPKQVILIMTDTQRKDMFGCYGNSDLKTPNIDKLAAQSIRFERAYCCQPVCGPARSALFTGTFPHSNGSWGNSMALGDNVKTIGQRLHDNQIHTAYIGKWHLDGGDYFGLGRCPDGWDPDYWYDMRNYLDELDSDKDRLRSRQPETNRENIDADFTFGHRCSNKAIDFLNKFNHEDFLLVVSYDEPHGPCLCPEPYASMYKDYKFPKGKAIYDDLSEKPEHHRVWSGDFYKKSFDEKKAQTASPDPEYFGCHSFVDSEIGSVIDTINKLAPDALVIFTSDHGDMLNHHGMRGKGAASYDDITNIPFIVRWPKHTPPNSVCDHPVSHINVTPTILDYFNIPQSKIIQGSSLLKSLEDPELRVNNEIFIEFNRYEIDHDSFGGLQLVRSVFDGRYKFTVNLLTTDELYDLDTDPDEMINLIDSADHIQIRNTLHDRLIDWMNETRDPFRGYYWLNRPWRTDAPPPTWNFTNMTRQRDEDTRYEPYQLDYNTGLNMTAATRHK